MKWVNKNPLAQGCMRLIVAGDHNSPCPGKGRKFSKEASLIICTCNSTIERIQTKFIDNGNGSIVLTRLLGGA